MKTSLSPKGQATIPKPVRDFLGLKPGDKIEWHIHYEDDSVTLRTLSKEKGVTPEQAVEELHGILAGSNILEEYLKEKHAEIEHEEAELKQRLSL